MENVNCSTCAHSLWVKGKVHRCHMYQRDMHETAVCEDHIVMDFIPISLFGHKLPREDKC